MAVIESWVRCDLKKPVQVQMLGGNLFSMDNQGNKIGVEVFNNGAEASISGTVSGNVIRADGATVAVSGTLSGNKAYIVLPQAAYAVPGFITIVIKLTSSGVITTLAAVTGIVYRSSTDTTVDPGTIIPSIQTLIAEIDAAIASVPADYSTLWARLAPVFSDNTSYVGGRYVVYDGMLYRFKRSHTGSWNANDVEAINIGNEIFRIKDTLFDYDVFDTFFGVLTKNSGTSQGVTFTWNSSGSCSVSGGTGGTAAVNNMYANAKLPQKVVAGGKYRVIYRTTDTKVMLGFIFRETESGDPTYVYVTGDTDITIPAGTQYIAVRLYVKANTSITGTATVSKICMLSNVPVDAFNDLYCGNPKETNIPAGFTYFDGITQYDSSNRMKPKDMPVNSYVYTSGERLSEDFPHEDGKYYYLFRVTNLHSTANSKYFLYRSDENNAVTGRTADGGTTVYWTTNSGKDLKVLCIGSSFGQDSIVYAPFIVNTFKQDITLTMGCAYYSGATISQYSEWYDNDSSINYYKSVSGGAWSSGVTKTLKQILADEKWDIVTISQSALDGGVWSTFSDINTLLDKIAGYCYSQNGKGVKLGYVMPQASLTYSSRYVYSDMVSCVENIMNTTPISFFIPCGTAIETARGTSLNSIGDAGGLTYDAGTGAGHLQEGLPVLLSSYVTALKLMELCGYEYIGIMGNNLRPTAAWVSERNIPGQNGTCTGVTNANCLLAQKCAVAAIKKPLAVSTIA